MKNIKPLRFQTSDIRKALLEFRETVYNGITRVKAHSLAEIIGSLRFQICTAIFYEIFSKLNIINKLLQSETMQLDVALNLLSKIKTSLTAYRKNAFAAAEIIKKEVCGEMNTGQFLKEKKIKNTKNSMTY